MIKACLVVSSHIAQKTDKIMYSSVVARETVHLIPKQRQHCIT